MYPVQKSPMWNNDRYKMLLDILNADWTIVLNVPCVRHVDNFDTMKTILKTVSIASRNWHDRWDSVMTSLVLYPYA